MISTKEAKTIIESKSLPLNRVQLELNQTYGLTLAEDIIAPFDMPPFDQSAMDGYSFKFEDLNAAVHLKIIGQIAAGDDNINDLKSGEAMRIFTGAPLPHGADTVVMQEKIAIENDLLRIDDDKLKFESNVRKKGSHITSGQCIISRGQQITPAVAGLIAAAGINQIKVYMLPSVGVLISGNELIKPGNQLLHGQIFESNSFAIEAALKRFGIHPAKQFCMDDIEQMKLQINSFADKDFLIISGGISVGDYDFTLPALKQLGFDIYFHKVKQKPGKPFCFAGKKHQLVFALPGNPASVLTCFYEYVAPAIQLFAGNSHHQLETKFLKLSKSYHKKPGLTHFLKGKINHDKVDLLIGQESYRMDSFAQADCIVVVPEEISEIEKDMLVEVHPI